jgi:regulator of replication initiation timing
MSIKNTFTNNQFNLICGNLKINNLINSLSNEIVTYDPISGELGYRSIASISPTIPDPLIVQKIEAANIVVETIESNNIISNNIISNKLTLKNLDFQTFPYQLYYDYVTGETTFGLTGGGGASQWISISTNIYYNLGNVGIGTTTPSEKLHVNGNAIIGNLYTNEVILNGNLLSNDLYNIFNNITDIKANLTNVYSNISRIDGNINLLFSNVTDIKANLTNVYSNISRIDGNINLLFSNITDIKANLTNVYSNISRIDGNINLLFSNLNIINSNIKIDNGNITLYGNIYMPNLSYSNLGSNVVFYGPNGNLTYGNLDNKYLQIPIGSSLDFNNWNLTEVNDIQLNSISSFSIININNMMDLQFNDVINANSIQIDYLENFNTGNININGNLLINASNKIITNNIASENVASNIDYNFSNVSNINNLYVNTLNYQTLNPSVSGGSSSSYIAFNRVTTLAFTLAAGWTTVTINAANKIPIGNGILNTDYTIISSADWSIDAGNNRLVYNGSTTKIFYIQISTSVSLGTTGSFGIQLNKNLTAISQYRWNLTAGALNDQQDFNIISLSNGDYIEWFFSPSTSTGTTFIAASQSGLTSSTTKPIQIFIRNVE